MRAAVLACRIVQGRGDSGYSFLLAEGHWGQGERLALELCVSVFGLG